MKHIRMGKLSFIIRMISIGWTPCKITENTKLPNNLFKTIIQLPDHQTWWWPNLNLLHHTVFGLDNWPNTYARLYPMHIIACLLHNECLFGAALHLMYGRQATTTIWWYDDDVYGHARAFARNKAKNSRRFCVLVCVCVFDCIGVRVRSCVYSSCRRRGDVANARARAHQAHRQILHQSTDVPKVRFTLGQHYRLTVMVTCY